MFLFCAALNRIDSELKSHADALKKKRNYVRGMRGVSRKSPMFLLRAKGQRQFFKVVFGSLQYKMWAIVHWTHLGKRQGIWRFKKQGRLCRRAANKQ